MTRSQDPSITYRIAEPGDVSALAALRCAFMTEDAPDFDASKETDFREACVEQLGATIDDPDWVHWIAESHDQIFAVVSVRRVPRLPEPDCLRGHWGYVTNTYTLPSHRNRGVGGDLLAEVKRWAIDRDLELLIVWPSDQAHSFYERAGFRRYDDPLVLKIDPNI